VYWTEGQDVIPGRGTVKRVPIAGGPVTTLANSQTPGPIAFDGSYVYWIAFSNSSAEILRVSVAGGQATNLATAGLPCAIAVDATNVYWADVDAFLAKGSIVKVTKSGGTPITLATVSSLGCAIAVDATNVYWVATESGFSGGQPAIMKLPLAGGTPSVAVSLAQPAVDFVVNSAGFYGSYDGALWRAPLSGGAATTFDVATPIAKLAADSTSVYWTTGCFIPFPFLANVGECGGAILKLTPK
jgi:hypothetical protein